MAVTRRAERQLLFKYSRLSAHQVEIAIHSFAQDRPATQAAKLAGISARAMNVIYQRLRERLCDIGLDDLPFSDGQLDQFETSPEFDQYLRDRCAEARGWTLKYYPIHWFESYQRFVRRGAEKHSVLNAMYLSLGKRPLSSVQIRSELTYAACDAAHKLAMKNPRPANNPFRD